ncbi:hypothetical protein FKM82_008220 [Ascaphus truei]
MPVSDCNRSNGLMVSRPSRSFSHWSPLFCHSVKFLPTSPGAKSGFPYRGAIKVCFEVNEWLFLVASQTDNELSTEDRGSIKSFNLDFGYQIKSLISSGAQTSFSSATHRLRSGFPCHWVIWHNWAAL